MDSCKQYDMFFSHGRTFYFVTGDNYDLLYAILEKDSIAFKKQGNNIMTQLISMMFEYNGADRQRGAVVDAYGGKFRPADDVSNQYYYADINNMIQDYMTTKRKEYTGKYTIIVTSRYRAERVSELIRKEGFNLG